MKNLSLVLSLILITGFCWAEPARASRHSLGVGVHYFRSLDEITDEEEFDQDGLGYNVSYRFQLIPLLAVQAEAQFFPEGLLWADQAYAGKVFIHVGGTLYGALGVGTTYVDQPDGDTYWSKGEYQLRAGVDLRIIPDALGIDINANYILVDWRDLDDLEEKFDEDTITFGAAVRFFF